MARINWKAVERFGMAKDCPVCGGNTTVYDTECYNERLIRRRRCLECGKTYNTMEVYLEELINAQNGDHQN